jgi:hypothetical protein
MKFSTDKSIGDNYTYFILLISFILFLLEGCSFKQNETGMSSSEPLGQFSPFSISENKSYDPYNDSEVNLMWIAKEKSTYDHIVNGKNIVLPFPVFTVTGKDFNTKDVTTFDILKEWNAKGITPNLWYDSETSFCDEGSQEELLKYGINVVLKDIRELETVKANNQLIRVNQKISIYYLADLLRVVACMEGKKRYQIYGDWVVVPKKKEEMLDNETLKKLDGYGIVMCKPEGLRMPENSFFLLDRNVDKCMISLKTGLVDIGIEVLKFAHNPVVNKQVNVLEQNIYDLYKFFVYPFIVGRYDSNIPMDLIAEQYTEKDCYRLYGEKKEKQEENVFSLSIMIERDSSIRVLLCNDTPRDWSLLSKKYPRSRDGLVEIPTKEMKLLRYSNHSAFSK